MSQKIIQKQLVFCQKYVSGMTAKDAAIEAGYSPKSAASQGSRLMQIPLIKREIQRLRDLANLDSIMDHEEAAETLTAIIRDKAKRDAARINACSLLAKLRGWEANPKKEEDNDHSLTIKIVGN